MEQCRKMLLKLAQSQRSWTPNKINILQGEPERQNWRRDTHQQYKNDYLYINPYPRPVHCAAVVHITLTDRFNLPVS